MYRRAAAQGPLTGVGAGAYAGGRKVVDAGKLTRAAKQRLADCLAGRSEPSPIVYDRPSALASSVRAVWGAVLGVVVLTLTFARGFDDTTSRWEVQPVYAIAIYALAAALFSFSLLAVLRRRFLVGGDALRPGRYLLPLDLVEIAPIDARGRQRITVRPLGDARDAMVRGEGRKAELVIVFDDTSQVAFSLRTDPGGQVTLRRLEHAQRLLEELTYTKDLAEAFQHDPFFDLRADGSWSSAQAADEDAPVSLRTKQSLVAGRAGPIVAGAIAALVAGSTFGIRNSFAHRLIAAREARAERERSIAAARLREREEDLRREEEENRRSKALAAKKAEEQSPEHCLKKLREGASPTHGQVPKIVEAMIGELERTNSTRVPVVVNRTNAAGGWLGDLHWSERERTTIDTFERVFAESCSPRVIRFAIDDVATDWGLFVDYVVTWPKKFVVRRRGVLGETIEVSAMNVVFDVRLVGPNKSGTEKFRLTMPPPDKLAMAHRAQSIFPSTLEDDGSYDERVYESMTARAFDRLYDEVWSLFFSGPPKVPVDRPPTTGFPGFDP